MCVTGEFLVTPVHVTPVQIELGTVIKRIFYRIGIEILVDIVVAVMTSTGCDGVDWPCILHPAAFVDVVDEIVAERAAAGPEETVEAPDLVQQFVFVFLR